MTRVCFELGRHSLIQIEVKKSMHLKAFLLKLAFIFCLTYSTLPGRADAAPFSEGFESLTGSVSTSSSFSFWQAGVEFTVTISGGDGATFYLRTDQSHGSGAKYLEVFSDSIDLSTTEYITIERRDGLPWIFKSINAYNRGGEPLTLRYYPVGGGSSAYADLGGGSLDGRPGGSGVTVTRVTLDSTDFQMVFDDLVGDTTLPTPTITSATYNASTGALVVTGTNLSSVAGAMNDIVVSKLTLTGEGGATYTLTSSNVDIASSTSFSVTLNANDSAAVNMILNKNGTSSTGSTTYNLAAAEDWAAGADAAVVVADLTGNGVTVSNAADTTAPTVTSVNSSTANGTYNVGNVISIQVNFSESVTVIGTPQLTLETGAIDQVINYASGSGSSALTFNYTVQSGDISADLDYVSTSSLALNAGTIKDAAGNNATLTLAVPGAANSLGGNKALVIDGVAPTATIVVADTSLTAGETSQVTFTFSEAVTGFGNADLTIANGTLSAVSSGDGGITWTATLTPTASVTDATNVITLVMTGVLDAAGNAGAGTTSSNNYAIDTVPALSLSPAPGALSGGTVGSAYSVTISASNGSSPYSYSVTAGALPAGLSLNTSTGALSGTPTLAGNFNFTVTTADSLNATSSAAYSIAVQATAPGAPTIGTATAGDTLVNVAFTAPVGDGGAAITSYTVTSNPGGLTSTGGSSPIIVTGLTNGTAYTFTVTATNATGTSAASAASNSVTPGTNATPASEFAVNETSIRQVIEGEAIRSLSSASSTDQRMTRDARKRLVTGQIDPAANASASTLPLQIDGSLDAGITTLSSQGTFFGQSGLREGARRLVFGDFDIQHDTETGSSTATLNGRIAWEHSVSDKTLLGYFIGGELARSNIAGSFDGDQNRVGVSVGGYAVHEIAQQVYVDGFVRLGAGRNNLTMSNGVLDLDSDYTTRTATMGAAVSGVIEQQGFDILPELSLSFGRTWIGYVGFRGAAHTLVDNTLSLDAGTVTLANILFRPEFRVPMDGLSGAQSLQVFTFAPRLSCEQVKATVTEENCGAGAEFGFSGSSLDGLSSVSAKIMADRLGDRTTSSVQLNLQHRF